MPTPPAPTSTSLSSVPERFMVSRRVVAGRPDTEFFWVKLNGYQCVAKQLSQELGPQVVDLVKNERRILRLLNDHKAPVCQLVEDPDHPDWLITRFAGLSLQVLGPRNLPAWPPLPLRERVSVWVGFLLRAKVLADLGAVPLDLSDRNLVVPLGYNEKLDLSSAVSIDHAHTVVHSAKLPGGALCRPVWIGAKNNHQLAPEVRDCLVRDQDRFLKQLKEKGAAMPGTTEAVEDEDQVTHRMWLAYSEPQEVQIAVDHGDINADKAIQYAVGHAIHRHLAPADPLTPALAAVVLRLCSQHPAHRYPKLEHAADALNAALDGRCAMSSTHAYRPDLPKAMSPPTESSATLLNLDDVLPDATHAVESAHPTLGEGSTQMVEPASPPATSPSPDVADARAGALPKHPRPTAAWWPHAVAALLALAVGWPLGQWLATLSAP